MDTITTTADKELFIKMVLSNWEMQIGRMNSLLNKLSDAELATPTAPGRNTGVYLLGHLAAISDAMFVLLGVGEKLNPTMYEVFVSNPENSGLEKPSIAELKEYWNKVNYELAQKINSMPVDEWFAPHTAMKAEDFIK